MSEEGEIWRSFKDEIRERKNDLVESFRIGYIPILKEENFTVVEYNVNSFRIKNQDGETIDYFPSSGKYHIHSSGFRGKVYITKCLSLFIHELKGKKS